MYARARDLVMGLPMEKETKKKEEEKEGETTFAARAALLILCVSARAAPGLWHTLGVRYSSL